MVYEPLITKDIPYRAYIWFGKDFGPHWHNEMEVMYCMEGEILVKADDREYMLQPGQVLFLPGNESHHFYQQNKHTYLVILKFGYSLLGSNFAKIQSKGLCIHVDELPENMRAPLFALRDFLQAGNVTGPDTDWFFRAQLFLLSHGLQKFSVAYRPSEKQSSRTARLESIYPVLDYVKDHYQEQISVEDAANLTGYAKTYFCRQFKLITGVSFHRYLNHYRITMACLMLEDPSLSVGEVAEMTGFSSSKLFCRTFKDITGMTTSQYQKLAPDKKSIHWVR